MYCHVTSFFSNGEEYLCFDVNWIHAFLYDEISFVGKWELSGIIRLYVDLNILISHFTIKLGVSKYTFKEFSPEITRHNSD